MMQELRSRKRTARRSDFVAGQKGGPRRSRSVVLLGTLNARSISG